MSDVMDEDIVDLGFPMECLPAVDELLKRHRNTIIEGCAQEVDRIAASQMRQGMMGARARDRLIEAAAAIRALKDKP